MSHDRTTSRILVETSSAAVNLPRGTIRLPLRPLPAKYADWLAAGRQRLYDGLLGGVCPVRFFSQHLPVLVTQGEGSVFPFNCCHKGVGLIPKEEYLCEFIELFRTTLAKAESRPWQESLHQRIQAASKFHFSRDKIDYRAMSTLEIFQRQTFQNLRRVPLASLLFSGDAPDYVSFQLNCTVEILEPGEPRHTFVMLARRLFEYDSFHLTQRHFPHAYIFWISDVLDKTPFRMAAAPEHGTLPEPDGGRYSGVNVSRSCQCAPAMIQNGIREKCGSHIRRDVLTEADRRSVQKAKKRVM